MTEGSGSNERPPAGEGPPPGRARGAPGAATAAAVAGLAASAVSDPGRLATDDRAWDAFASSAPTGSFMQLTAWARVKRPNGWTAARVVTAGPTVGDGGSAVGAQVLLRRAPAVPWTLGYAPRGPLAATFDDRAIQVFTEALRANAGSLHLSYVRVEPELPDDPDVASWFERAGWRHVEGSLQPAVTRLIDLRRTEEELWSDLRQKWRQYVNKARRSGIAIRPGTARDLPAFYRLYEETSRRAGFYRREEQSYQAVWDAFAPAGQARLLFARSPDGEPLATLFLVGCGARMTELYGGMNLIGAEAHANYLLKWEAISRARDEGFADYDLWGLAHPGIAHFKAGFGGREVRWTGAWELVIDPLGRAGLEVGRRVSLGVARARDALLRRQG